MLQTLPARKKSPSLSFCHRRAGSSSRCSPVRRELDPPAAAAVAAAAKRAWAWGGGQEGRSVGIRIRIRLCICPHPHPRPILSPPPLLAPCCRDRRYERVRDWEGGRRRLGGPGMGWEGGTSPADEDIIPGQGVHWRTVRYYSWPGLVHRSIFFLASSISFLARPTHHNYHPCQ